MSFFTNPQFERLTSAERVAVTCLVEARFASETVRLTEEAVPFIDQNNVRWEPGHGLISFSDIGASRAASADKRTYTIAAVDGSLAMAAVGREEEFRGREILQYLQFFTHKTVTGSSGEVASIREAAGPPNFIARHLMDKAALSVNPSGVASLQMECESLFVTKGRSPYGLVTQTDQRARYPDDAGLDRMPDLLRGKVIRWPDF